MVKVFTGRVSYTGPDRLDITIKNNRHHPLAPPSWNLVMGHKLGQIPDREYIAAYQDHVRVTTITKKYELAWLADAEEVTLVCYCAKGKFCHRHLAVDLLEEYCQAHGIPFERGGER